MLVVIAAQQAAKGVGRIRLTRVPDASAKSLEPAIAAAIETGSQVRTDDWKGYSGLDRLGYRQPAQALRSAKTCCRWPTGWRIQQAVDLSPVPANEIRGGQRPTENQPIDVT